MRTCASGRSSSSAARAAVSLAIARVSGASLGSVDLTDAAACRQAIQQLGDTTHLLYAALYEKPELVAGWRDPEQMAINEAMLRNLMDALQTGAKGLRLIPFFGNARFDVGVIVGFFQHKLL